MMLRMDWIDDTSGKTIMRLVDETHNCLLDEWVIFSSDDQDKMRNDLLTLGFNI